MRCAYEISRNGLNTPFFLSFLLILAFGACVRWRSASLEVSVDSKRIEWPIVVHRISNEYLFSYIINIWTDGRSVGGYVF